MKQRGADMVILLNGIAIPYKDGITITERYNETLDVGQLIIPQVAELAVEPMDVVQIDSKYMLVSSVTKRVSKWVAPKEYNYEIGLISPTIKLQRIILPNRSITQRVGGTPKYLIDIINQYVQMYAPQFSVARAIVDKCDDVLCPEFQWNRPTLFEVLNDLLSVVNCVVTVPIYTTMGIGVISCLDLATRGSAIPDTYLNNLEETHTIEEYASHLEIEAENAVVKYKNTSTIDYVTARTTQDVFLNTSNLEIVVDKPIYKVNKVLFRYVYEISMGTWVILEADISNRIVEKSVYDLMALSNSTGDVAGEYKRDRLYYVEGSNFIGGLGYSESTIFGISSNIAIVNILRNIIPYPTNVDIPTSGPHIFNFVYYVEYTTIDNVKFKAEKQVPYKYESTLVDNQDTTYVDTNALANREQQRINRMGNAEIIITGKCPLLTNVPALAQTRGVYVLTERTYVLYNNYVQFSGKLSKYYASKYMFAGINTKRRYTRLASESEALMSNHLTRVELILSTTNATVNAPLENYMLQFGKANSSIKTAVFQATLGYMSYSPLFAVAGASYRVGNSVVYTFKMQNNISVGHKIVLIGTTPTLQDAKYVDDYGEFITCDIALYKSINNIDIYSDNDDKFDAGVVNTRNYPQITPSLLDINERVYSRTGLYRYKDNREITAETLQFVVNSNEDIVVGDLFFMENPMVYSGVTDKQLYVAWSNIGVYTYGDNTIKGNMAEGFTVTITGNSINVVISDEGFTWANVSCWAICDSTGKLYIGVNATNNTIYLTQEV